MKRTIFPLLAVALICLIPTPTQANLFIESRLDISIESHACKAEIILVGKITHVVKVKGPNQVTYEDCTVQITEVIKGKVNAKKFQFCIRSLNSRITAVPCVNSPKGVLLFLSLSRNHGPEPHLNNQYVLSPTSPLANSLLNLSNLPKTIYSKNKKIIKNSDALLKTVRIWGKSKLSGSIYINMRGPSHSLLVPAEEKYRKKFMTMARSKNQYERATGAGNLRNFPGKETETILRELLKDKSTNLTSSGDRIVCFQFGVRAAAHYSLKNLGKPVPANIQLKRKPTEQEQRSYRHDNWKRSLQEALKIADWKLTSLKDGITRQVAGQKGTTLIATCTNGKNQFVLTLIPNDWPKEFYPAGEMLGKSQRRFFFKGTMPAKTKKTLVKYFDFNSRYNQ